MRIVESWDSLKTSPKIDIEPENAALKMIYPLPGVYCSQVPAVNLPVCSSNFAPEKMVAKGKVVQIFDFLFVGSN